jgi:uncharacterized membrane protein YeaQ/YmgE (transglycosylase-associated protein family)
MGIIIGIIVGSFAGIVAQRLTRYNAPDGWAGDLAVGIIGGAIGGFSLSLVGLGTGGTIVGSFVVAVIGASVLLWGVRQLRSVS